MTRRNQAYTVIAVTLALIILALFWAIKSAYAGGYEGYHGYGKPQQNVYIKQGPVQGGNVYMKPGAVQGGSAYFKPGAVQGGNANFANGAVRGGNANFQNGALQSRSGASANVTIQGDSVPANQQIEYVTVPGLGTQFIPPAVNCYPAAAAQGVGMGGGGSVTASFYSLPCHFMSLANTNASIGVAAVNAGAVTAPGVGPNLAVMAAGQEAVLDSLDLLAGTDPNLYLLRKAKGRTPPIRPDRRLSDSWLGGLVDQHVLPNGEYQPPRPAPVHTHYDVPDSRDDNPGFDAVQKDRMMK